MAENTYTVGDSSNQVTIIVVVSTPGSADSEVLVGSNLVTQSTDATGAIPKFTLGTCSSLQNTTLEIDTDIKLDFIPSTEWPSDFANLVIKYFLDGGADGPKTFTLDNDDKTASSSGKTIMAEKFIALS